MKTDYQNAIIDKIRKLRLAKSISQYRLATAIGISTGQIGNIETPARPHKYTLEQLSIICDEFEIRIQDLFLDNPDSLKQDELVKRLINSIIEYEK